MENELIQSEARFRALADGSNDIVWRLLLEPEPHFDYISPSMEQITGRPPSYLLEDFSRFFDTLDDDSRVLLARAVRGELIPERVDISGWRADGSGDDDLPARLERALALPIEITPSLSVTCRASIGRADTIACGYDAIALLTAADAAMYETKRPRHPSAGVT